MSAGAAIMVAVAAFVLLPGGRPAKQITAVHFGGVPTVGALFAGGTAEPHFCTAGVVTSPGRNLIVTAAHCVSGSGKGLVFVPGYRAGQAPYGTWDVVAAYGAPGWLTGQDPHEDVAFLVVADRNVAGRTIAVQDLTGAPLMGATPSSGQPVTVVAYPQGQDDLPIRCRASIYFDDGYPAFDCGGYVNGTSGAPWVTRTRSGARQVVAVSGGRNQGGCEAGTSYASPFTAVIERVYRLAISRSQPSMFPTPGPSGC